MVNKLTAKVGETLLTIMIMKELPKKLGVFRGFYFDSIISETSQNRVFKENLVNSLINKLITSCFVVPIMYTFT